MDAIWSLEVAWICSERGYAETVMTCAWMHIIDLPNLNILDLFLKASLYSHVLLREVCMKCVLMTKRQSEVFNIVPYDHLSLFDTCFDNIKEKISVLQNETSSHEIMPRFQRLNLWIKLLDCLYKNRKDSIFNTISELMIITKNLDLLKSKNRYNWPLFIIPEISLTIQNNAPLKTTCLSFCDTIVKFNSILLSLISESPAKLTFNPPPFISRLFHILIHCNTPSTSTGNSISRLLLLNFSDQRTFISNMLNHSNNASDKFKLYLLIRFILLGIKDNLYTHQEELEAFSLLFKIIQKYSIHSDTTQLLLLFENNFNSTLSHSSRYVRRWRLVYEYAGLDFDECILVKNLLKENLPAFFDAVDRLII